MDQVSILSQSVEGKVSDLKKQYGVSTASVYYRDLDNGDWIGVNEKEQFASASLIKLPILISLLKESEVNPLLLSKNVLVTASDTDGYLSQNIKPDTVLTPGQSYSIQELSERMIEESDNAATMALLRNIDEKYRTGIFESIGVAFSADQDDIMINVKDYSGFFRVLFNASYLDRTRSEAALAILAKSTFNNGLVAGVPAGVTVAHKFGERSNYINGLLANRQLHDCGIVYYPNKPYILCVMTRGDDYANQEAFVRDVSAFFYKQVDSSIRKNRKFSL